LCLTPRRIAVVEANASAAPHAGAKPVARLGDSGKAVSCRKVPSGANRKVIAATIAAARCAAMRCVSRRAGVVVAVGANLRFNCVPCYHDNLCRGRRPRRPLSGLPHTLALYHCTRSVWVRSGTLVYLRALRVGTRNCLPHRDSAGRGVGVLRQIPVATRRHLLSAHRAKARHSAILSGFECTDTFTCRNANT
jgi:hypothetical protein